MDPNKYKFFKERDPFSTTFEYSYCSTLSSHLKIPLEFTGDKWLPEYEETIG